MKWLSFLLFHFKLWPVIIALEKYIVASYLLTFFNFVLDYSNNLFIWNQTKPRFPPYNPKNMVRTSPHFLIRSGSPGLYKSFFASDCCYTLKLSSKFVVLSQYKENWPKKAMFMRAESRKNWCHSHQFVFCYILWSEIYVI